jgi:hypothetical protein
LKKTGQITAEFELPDNSDMHAHNLDRSDENQSTNCWDTTGTVCGDIGERQQWQNFTASGGRGAALAV